MGTRPTGSSRTDYSRRCARGPRGCRDWGGFPLCLSSARAFLLHVISTSRKHPVKLYFKDSRSYSAYILYTSRYTSSGTARDGRGQEFGPNASFLGERVKYWISTLCTSKVKP